MKHQLKANYYLLKNSNFIISNTGYKS